MIEQIRRQFVPCLLYSSALANDASKAFLDGLFRESNALGAASQCVLVDMHIPSGAEMIIEESRFAHCRIADKHDYFGMRREG